MSDEFAARQRAIALRLGGRPVKQICLGLGRTEAWFHKWWGRYLEFGVDGLFDQTRARHVAPRIPPELERTILSVRRRLQAHVQPRTRYALVGAFDNAREITGWGRAARYLSRVIRLCRRFGVEPVFIPLARPGDLRRELARLEEAVNTQHMHPRLGGLTPAQHRRRQRLQKLSQQFQAPTEAQPLAAGRVIFIRQVSVAGTVSVLSQSFRAGKRHRGLYLKLVLDTQRGWLTAYLNGHVLQRWVYQLWND